MNSLLGMVHRRIKRKVRLHLLTDYLEELIWFLCMYIRTYLLLDSRSLPSCATSYNYTTYYVYNILTQDKALKIMHIHTYVCA